MPSDDLTIKRLNELKEIALDRFNLISDLESQLTAIRAEIPAELLVAHHGDMAAAVRTLARARAILRGDSDV